MISIIASMQAVIFYFSLAATMFLLALLLVGLVVPRTLSNMLGKNLSRLKVFIILLVLFSVAAAVVVLTQPEDLPASNGHIEKTGRAGYYKVIEVVDGDTIKVDIEDKAKTVRLIGIDAPELPKECFAKQAKFKAQAILNNKQVKLKPDKSQKNKDSYGRLLRYVILEDGTNFNQLMIAGGFAKEFTFISTYKLQEEFKKTQEIAKDEKKGLWSTNICGPTPL